jgi:DNA-binding XRE family transcriptional regulator
MTDNEKGRPDGVRLHNRIAVLRTERGLSRQALAEALGVNYQTIGYLERGEYNPSLELALRIAELFALPVEAVFAREPFAPLSELVYRRPDITASPKGVDRS